MLIFLFVRFVCRFPAENSVFFKRACEFVCPLRFLKVGYSVYLRNAAEGSQRGVRGAKGGLGLMLMMQLRTGTLLSESWWAPLIKCFGKKCTSGCDNACVRAFRERYQSNGCETLCILAGYRLGVIRACWRLGGEGFAWFLLDSADDGHK